MDVTRDSPTWQPPTEDAEEIVTEALRDLARWLYCQLQAEYDHLTSDEAIEEGIIVNEYTFTEAGRRFGSPLHGHRVLRSGTTRSRT